MRVLLINQVFYPDVAATAQHGDDLARRLVRAGHEVDVIASRAAYGSRGAALPRREDVDGVRIHRVGRSLFGKAGLLARAADFALFYLLATFKAFLLKRPDVVVCFTTPPFIPLLGWLLARTRGGKCVYWSMDLYPDVAVACGVFAERSIVARVFESVNRFALRHSDHVVVLGRCMRERVLGKGAPEEKVTHIGVWADQTEVAPIPRESNPYRDEWSLGDRFVVMYSGNFGIVHDVETMCRAAESLRDDDRFRFIFAGGGKRKPEVEAFVNDRALENCVLAPYQPRERLGESLSCADLHLASLRAGVEGIVVPCKLFGVMAAGRPCVFIGSPRSELARVLAEHECGETIPPGDVEALVAAIRAFAEDPARAQRMGDAARRALSAAYSREVACEQWRTLLESLVSERR